MQIGFLLSGSGSTLQNFLDLEAGGNLRGHIAAVISSKPNVQGLERSRTRSIPSYVVDYKEYKSDLGLYSRRITELFQKHGVELVLMGGFLSFYEVPPVYAHKVLNVHPSLIPAFCGQGMYGAKVHQKVLEYGVKYTGCTVHLVDNHYDNGPIVAQAVVPVADDDTVESLSGKVQKAERALYPQVVNDFIAGLYHVEGRIVKKRSLT